MEIRKQWNGKTGYQLTKNVYVQEMAAGNKEIVTEELHGMIIQPIENEYMYGIQIFSSGGLEAVLEVSRRTHAKLTKLIIE